MLTVTAAGSGPTAFTYQTETSNLRTAMGATGTPISTARSRRWDRAVRVMKACGGWDTIGGLHLNAFDTEANWLKNLVSPGTYDLTKIGNPTFVPNGDITHTVSTDCYRSSATLLDMPRNDHGMGVFTNVAATGNGIACGARDSGGKGSIIVQRGTSGTQALFQSSATANVTACATLGGQWTGNGWSGFDRDNSASIRTHHESAPQHVALAHASVAITEAVQLQVLGANGTTSVSSVGVQGFYWLKRAWTATQARICISIIRDFLDSVRYGEPYIEEIGIGTATASYDAVFYGLSLMSICGARAARQNGLTACIVGDRQDATITSLGGMVAAGALNWVDMTAANIAGQYREMLKWLNVEYYGRADSNTQLNASPDARAVNLACRRALDPTRTTGTGWLGMDIPVFMSGGPASVEKVTDPRGGMKVTKLITNDGRAFTGKFFSDGSYEGDLVPLIGAPFIFGREQAAASGLENKNGLRNQPASLLLPKNDSTGTTFKINPYVNNDPAQGLLPDMELLPTGTPGSPDPANQSVNIRYAAHVCFGALYQHAVRRPTAQLQPGSIRSTRSFVAGNYRCRRNHNPGRLADVQPCRHRQFLRLQRRPERHFERSAGKWHTAYASSSKRPRHPRGRRRHPRLQPRAALFPAHGLVSADERAECREELLARRALQPRPGALGYAQLPGSSLPARADLADGQRQCADG